MEEDEGGVGFQGRVAEIRGPDRDIAYEDELGLEEFEKVPLEVLVLQVLEQRVGLHLLEGPVPGGRIGYEGPAPVVDRNDQILLEEACLGGGDHDPLSPLHRNLFERDPHVVEEHGERERGDVGIVHLEEHEHVAVDAVLVAVGADVPGVEGLLGKAVLLHERPHGIERLARALLAGLSQAVCTEFLIGLAFLPPEGPLLL